MTTQEWYNTRSFLFGTVHILWKVLLDMQRRCCFPFVQLIDHCVYRNIIFSACPMQLSIKYIIIGVARYVQSKIGHKIYNIFITAYNPGHSGISNGLKIWSAVIIYTEHIIIICTSNCRKRRSQINLSQFTVPVVIFTML